MGDESQPLGPVTADNLLERFPRLEASDPAPDAQGSGQPSETKEAAAAVPPSVAAATDATPAPLPEDWYDKGLAVNHGWLKGRKGAEVETAFRAAQLKIEEQGKQLRERGPAPVAAPPANLGANAPAPPSGVAADDPRRAEYAAAVYTDPDRAREIVLEWTDERIAQRMDEREESRSTEASRDSAVSAGRKVRDQLVAGGLAEATATFRIVKAVAPEMEQRASKLYADYGGDENPAALNAWRAYWQNPQNYLEVYREIYGDAPGATVIPIAVPKTTQQAAPPGGKGAAGPAPKAATVAASVSAETSDSLSRLGGDLLSADGLARVRQRLAARGVR